MHHDLRSHALADRAMTEAEFRGPSPAANIVQVDARELAALRKVRDKAESFLARACDQQIKLQLDTAWMLGELCDAIHAVDDHDATP